MRGWHDPYDSGSVAPGGTLEVLPIAPTTAAEGVHLGTALRPILLERIKSQRTLGDDGVPREAHIGQY